MNQALHYLLSLAVLVGQPAPLQVTAVVGTQGALDIGLQGTDRSYSALVQIRVFRRDEVEVLQATSGQNLLASSGSVNETISLGQLPDGDYRVRIVAAAIVGGSVPRRYSSSTDIYIRRQQMSFTEMTDGDWRRLGPPDSRVEVELPQAAASIAERVAQPVPLAAVVSGTVAGNVTFFQNQGGWCPSTSTCVGSRYLQSEFASPQPFRDAKVIVLDGTTGAQIGESVTDGNGNYFASWVTSGTGPALVNVMAISSHRDARFSVTTGDGTLYGVSSTTGPQSALPDVTTSMPAIAIGSASNPNRYANVFDGARRAWAVLSTSNRMLAYFTNVQIRLLSTPLASCPFSCTSGSAKVITLNPSAAFTPEPRVLHEIGHLVSYLASRDQSFRSTNDYCYPNAGLNCSWSPAEEEWGSSQFEEGFATFVGDTALFAQQATEPLSCGFSAGQCGGPSLELSSSCGPGRSRWPLSVVRYLWDIYDAPQDVPGELQSRPFYEFVDTIHSFNNGVDNRQKDEAWYLFWVDDLDGRSAVDFRENWKLWGQDTTLAWGVNCSPVGD